MLNSDNNISLYYEYCDQKTMPTYPFFIKKLKQVQKITTKFNSKKIDFYDIQSIIQNITLCDKCKNNKFYQLGNIVWSENVMHKIGSHQSYPTEYFIKIIINTYVINDKIINPPIKLKLHQINDLSYVPLRYNILLIIDALMKQGSYPRYMSTNGKFIYSEHSGVLSIKNKMIDNLIISAETNRLDPNDDTIYLPINTNNLAQYEYLFHTHPNTTKYAGRINEGIIYEFPSANDILNFVKYHNEGKAQASLIIAPEGTYIIRQIEYQKKYNIDPQMFFHLRKFILKLEKIAIKQIKLIDKISNPDVFHKKIGSNFTYIRMYNRFIEPYNLLVEYYPRIKKNGEWVLRQINLPLVVN